MLIFLLILAMIIISGLNVKGKNDFYEDYCSPKNTATVNAVFSVLIFLSHSVSYLDLSNSAMNSSYIELSFTNRSCYISFLFGLWNYGIH